LEIAGCMDPGHPLYRYGLLVAPSVRDAVDWQQPLERPSAVAGVFLRAEVLWPAVLCALSGSPARELNEDGRPLVARLRSAPPTAMQVVPLEAPRGSDFEGWAHALSHATQRGLVRLADDVTPDRPGLAALATVCWLYGADLLLPEHWRERCCAAAAEGWFGSVAALPLRWYMPLTGEEGGTGLPSPFLMPSFTLPRLGAPARASR